MQNKVHNSIFQTLISVLLISFLWINVFSFYQFPNEGNTAIETNTFSTEQVHELCDGDMSGEDQIPSNHINISYPVFLVSMKNLFEIESLICQAKDIHTPPPQTSFIFS